MSSCCPPVPPKDSHSHDSCHTSSKFDYLLYGSVFIVSLAYLWVLVVDTQGMGLVRMDSFSTHLVDLMNRMWVGIFIGFVFVGLLNRVPREFVISALGNSKGLKGILRATMAGLVFDLCNHGILMVGMKLYERGAHLGQVMAFLIASPWNSLSLTVILISLIGWKWTLIFVAASGVIAIISGWIFSKLVESGSLPANPNFSELPENFRFWPEVKKKLGQQKWHVSMVFSILKEGVLESRMILRWLFFGVILTALLQTFVATEHMQHFFGPSNMGLLLTLLVTTVLEVCSEGSTPIAADIFQRAAAPGNAFTFLMAGVATDYTEILVVKDTMKSWKIALFIPLVTVPQVLILGWIFNGLG